MLCEWPTQQIVYSFRDSSCVRLQATVRDSLLLPVVARQAYFQGMARDTGLIDELEVTIRAERDTFPLQARTRYAARELVTAFRSLAE